MHVPSDDSRKRRIQNRDPRRISAVIRMKAVRGEKRTIAAEERPGRLRNRREDDVQPFGLCAKHAVHLSRTACGDAAEDPRDSRWRSHVGRTGHDDPDVGVRRPEGLYDRAYVGPDAAQRREVRDVVRSRGEEHDVGAEGQGGWELKGPNIADAGSGDREIRHRDLFSSPQLSRSSDRNAGVVVAAHSGCGAIAEHDVGEWRPG